MIPLRKSKQNRFHITARHARGMTLIELLVVMAVIGSLVGITLPAVQMSRESARRMTCANNLRQLGIALAAFESSYGRLPAGRDASNSNNHSWSTALLPYLDQSAVYNIYDYDYSPEHPQNLSASTTTLAVFRCPSAVEKWPGKTDYGGNYGSALTGLLPGFGSGRAWEAGTLITINLPHVPGVDVRTSAVAMSDITDGASQTFAVLENADRPRKNGAFWATGHNCFAHDNGPINGETTNEISSRHPGGAQCLFADGSAHFLSESIDLFVLGAFCTRAGNEVNNLQ